MIKVRYLILTFLLTLPCILFAQNTTRVNALKANNYGVTYSLPKTSFEITLLVKKTTYRKGEYYPYAQRYLGIDNLVTDNKVMYTLENISVQNKGIPDKENSFVVEFNTKSSESFVSLREDGIIAAINADPEIEATEPLVIPPSTKPSVNPRNFLSQETLMAGSTAKQAELVARQIFALRNSRTDILTGDAENMPPDGNAYKVVMEEMNLQEKALTELFAGSEEVEYFTRSYTIVPNDKNIEEKVIARFSEKLGPVDADNLAGEPITLSLVNKTPKVEIALTERDQKRMESKFSQGIVYNIPGKADLIIKFKNNVQLNKEVDVVQYGTQDVLVRKMLDKAKQPVKVFFYPDLGAIKQIIQ